MKKGRIALLTSLGMLLVLGSRIAVSFARFSEVEQRFSTIHPGQSRESVETALGKPNYHEGRCSADFSPPQSCTLEYAYSHPFAPLLPDYYLVWFSSDGRVINADHETSP